MSLDPNSISIDPQLLSQSQVFSNIPMFSEAQLLQMLMRVQSTKTNPQEPTMFPQMHDTATTPSQANPVNQVGGSMPSTSHGGMGIEEKLQVVEDCIRFLEVEWIAYLEKEQERLESERKSQEEDRIRSNPKLVDLVHTTMKRMMGIEGGGRHTTFTVPDPLPIGAPRRTTATGAVLWNPDFTQNMNSTLNDMYLDVAVKTLCDNEKKAKACRAGILKFQQKYGEAETVRVEYMIDTDYQSSEHSNCEGIPNGVLCVRKKLWRSPRLNCMYTVLRRYGREVNEGTEVQNTEGEGSQTQVKGKNCMNKQHQPRIHGKRIHADDSPYSMSSNKQLYKTLVSTKWAARHESLPIYEDEAEYTILTLDIPDNNLDAEEMAWAADDKKEDD
ncbi:hypothetical protein C8Q75DRAFT_808303 [Abortiporus biennis]|nr:hypothetical protein C8Q75DRAFT_808303 [Abortiporus biennis]